MKKIIFFAALILCTVSTRLCAQFEGVIDFRHTYGEGPEARKATVSAFFKGQRMAFTTNEGGEGVSGKVIYRGDKRLLWVIEDKKRTYLEIDVSDEGNAADSGEQPVVESEKLKVTIHKTGKTETILGYPCEQILVESEGESHDLWCTAKLGRIFEGVAKSFGRMAQNKRGEDVGEWRSEIMKMNTFPLKTVTTSDGRITETEEVTKVEEKALPASMFEPPSGYTKQALGAEMNTLMKQMQEQMKDHGMGTERGGQKIDMEKLMKEMQEKMKNMKKDKDTTQDKDNE